MPVQIAEKPPAKKPYVAAKMTKSGNLTAKPQNTKTERTEPSVEIAMAAVTCSLSHKAPRAIAPKTEKALRRERRRIPVYCSRPKDVV